MQIALIGVGKIALDQHVPAIAAAPEWELAATVSREGCVPGVPACSGLDAMFAAHPGIAAVSVCLPPAPRFGFAAAALNAGRHVMLEKPPGATLSECHRLLALARARGVALFATWHSREADMVAPAKAWLAGKRLRRLRITWLEDVRRWHPGQDWVWAPGGFGVFDPGINALSILTEILPQPAHLTGAELDFPANRQTPIAASLRLDHPEGAEVTARFDWRHEGTETWAIEVETDAGAMRLLDGGARMEIDGAESGGADGPLLTGEYPRLYARFAKLAAQGGIDFDLAPLRLVADAMLIGQRRTVAPFDW